MKGCVRLSEEKFTNMVKICKNRNCGNKYISKIMLFS